MHGGGGCLNPFDLLGVTPNSSCTDVRKRYYALACLCHPDRGGTNEQMQTLHNAYEYVLRQVALNRESTLEDLEADFAAFCASQTAAPPAFVDIHADAFNLPRFNELFEVHRGNNDVDAAFEEGGYATVPSDLTPDYSPTVPDAPIDHFDAQVVVYKEPCPLVMPVHMLRDLTNTKLDDFSCQVGDLHVSDYRLALSPPHATPLDPTPRGDVMAAFDKLITERTSQRLGEEAA